MASFKCFTVLLAAMMVLFVSRTESRGLFSHMAIRNAHPEDKPMFTPPMSQSPSAEASVGMEQTVPELLPTSQRQVMSNDIFSYGTELNDFLKELERYVAIAGRPRFGRSTDTQMKEELTQADKVDSEKTPKSLLKTLSAVPELHIIIKLCRTHSACVVPKVSTK